MSSRTRPTNAPLRNANRSFRDAFLHGGDAFFDGAEARLIAVMVGHASQASDLVVRDKSVPVLAFEARVAKRHAYRVLGRICDERDGVFRRSENRRTAGAGGRWEVHAYELKMEVLERYLSPRMTKGDRPASWGRYRRAASILDARSVSAIVAPVAAWVAAYRHTRIAEAYAISIATRGEDAASQRVPTSAIKELERATRALASALGQIARDQETHSRA